jgi:hypothetical protein
MSTARPDAATLQGLVSGIYCLRVQSSTAASVREVVLTR